MAEASFNLALESLKNVIKHETHSLLEARIDVQLLIEKLQLIKTAIQNSGSRHEPSNIETETITQMREAAHDAEDLISKYELKVTRHKRMGKLRKILDYQWQGKMVHVLSKKIDDVNKRFDVILGYKEAFKREGASKKGEDSGAVLNLDVNVENVINFTDDMEKIVRMLTTGDERHVISILGMGGSGKTALAMKLCEHNQVKEHFSCVVMVTPEQRTSAVYILHQILCHLAEQMEDNQERKKFMGALDKEIERAQELDSKIEREHILSGVYQKLKHKLLKYFRMKRYLVVIDNLWESKLCYPLLNAFPDDSNGSRILITSRQKGVALSASENSSIHFISELGKDDVEKLFCNMVFGSESCPRNLEVAKNKVVEISHGLPIVTVVLGGLLKERRREELAWTNVIGNGNSYPAEGRKLWRDKLGLSYDQLQPLNLKFCFFYFCSFPANYEIPVRQLIQLWISEEFLSQNSDTTLEMAAEEYLKELIDGCLIQPTSWRLDGGVKTCRIHNVLRDLCLYESKNEDFLEVIHNDSDLSSDSRPRRLSLHYSIPDFISYSSSSNGCNTSSIRSLLCFGKDGDRIQRNHLEWLCKSIPMVRVLKLGDGQVQSIPERIRRLDLLKYLKLKGAELRVLPDSICELLNLETLDLRGSAVNCLPKRIWELQNLRHLYVSQPTKLPGPSDNSKIFPSLQIFSWLALDQDTVNLITRRKFPLLRKLGFYKHDQDGIPHNVFINIHQSLSHLERLKIKVPSSDHLILQSLFLELGSLTKITLVECEIDFAVLGNLSNLQYLKVHEGSLKAREGSSTGNALQCDENSFARLLGFQMTRFPIESWTISAGAMPQLQRLIIKACPNLQALPDKLQLLTMLEKVYVHRPCTEELVTIVEQMKTDREKWNRCDIKLFG